MTRAAPHSPAFYYLTDPESAAKIAERGFLDSGVYSRHSTLTLLDQVPSNAGSGIVLVRLTPESAFEALRRESSDPGEGYRKFLVPMELLKDAEVALVD